MNGQPSTSVQVRREAQFTRNMGAFMRRDFDAIAGTMQPDAIMEIAGSSWIAGTHQGYDAVSRCILGLRQVLDSRQNRITFLHEGDQMIVRHDIKVHGPMHEVEMTLRVRVRYDETGEIEAISVAPDDLGLFDHVLNTMLRNQSTA